MIPAPRPPRKIYLAGPMRGIPQFNFPLFASVSAYLRASGHEVFSPAAKDIERHAGVDISADNATGSLEQAQADHGFSLRQALFEDLAYICLTADMVLFLPGWEGSAGSQAEHRTAAALLQEGMEIGYLTDKECHFIGLCQTTKAA